MAITVNYGNNCPKKEDIRHMSDGDTFLYNGALYQFRKVVRRVPSARERGYPDFIYVTNMATGKPVELPLGAVGEPVDIEITVVRK